MLKNIAMLIVTAGLFTGCAVYDQGMIRFSQGFHAVKNTGYNTVETLPTLGEGVVLQDEPKIRRSVQRILWDLPLSPFILIKEVIYPSVDALAVNRDSDDVFMGGTYLMEYWKHQSVSNKIYPEKTDNPYYVDVVFLLESRNTEYTVRFLFRTKEGAEVFMENPQDYLPLGYGYDATCLSRGFFQRACPQYFSYVHDKTTGKWRLVFFKDIRTLALWERNYERYMRNIRWYGYGIHPIKTMRFGALGK